MCRTSACLCFSTTLRPLQVGSCLVCHGSVQCPVQSHHWSDGRGGGILIIYQKPKKLVRLAFKVSVQGQSIAVSQHQQYICRMPEMKQTKAARKIEMFLSFSPPKERLSNKIVFLRNCVWWFLISYFTQRDSLIL